MTVRVQQVETSSCFSLTHLGTQTTDHRVHEWTGTDAASVFWFSPVLQHMAHMNSAA